MSRFPLLRLLIVVGIAAAMGIASPTNASGPQSITIKLSDAKITMGTKSTVSGQGPALRSVLLEMKMGQNGWQPIGRDITDLTGRYAFAAPTWYGTHQLRVRVVATLLAPALLSETRTLRVTSPYQLRGAASDWVWLGQPGARWNPCETITYQVNTRGAYPHADADLAAAFKDVSEVTGFQFRDRGTTDAVVIRGRDGYHPPDIDIVIDWQTPEQEPGLTGNVAGIGGHWVLAGRRFDGWVLLDQSERLDRGMWQQIMTHELGHVLGLGHAKSPNEVMYASSSSQNRRWGAGDLAGLSRLGASQGCLN